MSEILDLIVIFLLVIGIVYGFILNRKIVLIQDSKKELADLFRSFDNTILKAQLGIDQLKESSHELTNSLQQKMDAAARLREDLAFLQERAVETSMRLEKTIGMASDVRVPERKKEPNDAYGLSPEEIRNLRARNAQPKKEPEVLASAERNQKKALALEGLLEKISEGKATRQDVKQAIPEKTVKASTMEPVAASGRNAKKEEVAQMLKSLGYGDS